MARKPQRATGLPDDDFDYGDALPPPPAAEPEPELSVEERVARGKANEEKAKAYLTGQLAARDLVDLRVAPEQLLAAAPSVKAERPARVPVYRVERDFQFSRQLGVTTLRAGKIVTSRDYDIEELSRMGCELVELPAR